jgi:hypothetical protein
MVADVEYMRSGGIPGHAIPVKSRLVLWSYYCSEPVYHFRDRIPLCWNCKISPPACQIETSDCHSDHLFFGFLLLFSY